MVKPRRIPKFDLAKAIEAFSSLDEEPVNFGKYKGWTPLKIAEEDPSYLVWAYETFPATRTPCSIELYELCKLSTDESPKKTRNHSYEEEKELDGHLRFK